MADRASCLVWKRAMRTLLGQGGKEGLHGRIIVTIGNHELGAILIGRLCGLDRVRDAALFRPLRLLSRSRTIDPLSRGTEDTAREAALLEFSLQRPPSPYLSLVGFLEKEEN